MLPTKVFFTKGVGIHTEKLASYEAALRSAGIAQFNLVKVSSIFPPGCKKISKEEGLKLLKPGEVVYCVISSNETNEPNRLIAASVGCAIPADSSQHGYLSEHHSFGQTEEKAGVYAENIAALMLATILGVEGLETAESNNPLSELAPQRDTMPIFAGAWEPVVRAAKMEGKITRTFNITQSALGNKDGKWTSVVAAAVFITEDAMSENAESLQENQLKLNLHNGGNPIRNGVK